MSRIAGLVVLVVLMALVAAFPAGAQVPAPPKTPTAEGWGGSAATVDPLATQAAIDVLRSGGNAVDAAVAAAGVLGVVEPFSCGIGGGGFMVIYDAKRHRVDTIDSREVAPADLEPTAFAGLQATSQFTEAYVSGLSVGVPGTVAGWEKALKRYGSRSLRSLLRPGRRIADEGFVVDQTFNGQVESNKEIFDDFTSTRDLYLPGGAPTPVDKVQANPDLAETYRRIGKDPDRFYTGGIARDIARTVQQPPLRPGAVRTAVPGSMTTRDLAGYRAIQRKPTKVDYRGLEVYGMGPPSSGGSTVGEALNILEEAPNWETLPTTQRYHWFLEASRLAFADRGAFLGDPGFSDIPLDGLLSQQFAAERAALIDPARAQTVVVGPGEPAGSASRSTTHLTVADADGMVVAYTFTIESTGGNGIVVPGWGFLLNNELTDFDFTKTGLPNSAGPGKRPRSSIAPTIVQRDGIPVLALGSPGGSTIITTVLQILLERFDLGKSLPQAIFAPRASQRNGTDTKTEAEQAFIDSPAGQELAGPFGHLFKTPALTPPVNGQIGAATGIEFRSRNRLLAAAEAVRRGGGSAQVVRP